MTLQARCACSRPVNGTTLCYQCTLRLETALVTIATFTPELNVALTRQAVFGDRSSGGHAVEVPLPFDERASEAEWVVRSTLTAWSVAIATQADPSPAPALVPMAVWLLARVHSIAILPDAAACLDEITSAAAHVARVIDRPPEHIYAGPCGDCNRPLYAKPGRSTVTCHDHDPTWSGDVAARREWMLGKAAAVLAHAAGAVRLLAVLEFRISAVQITRWVQAGRLAERGTDPNGRILYRIGDLIDLAASRGDERQA